MSSMLGISSIVQFFMSSDLLTHITDCIWPSFCILCTRKASQKFVGIWIALKAVVYGSCISIVFACFSVDYFQMSFLRFVKVDLKYAYVIFVFNLFLRSLLSFRHCWTLVLGLLNCLGWGH